MRIPASAGRHDCGRHIRIKTTRSHGTPTGELMRRIAWLGLGATLIAMVGCKESLPTLSGEDRFDSNIISTTVQYITETAQAVISAITVRGTSGIEDSSTRV